MRDPRENLLRTSRELLDEGEPATLSMREVACRAGRIHQAPYHYLANRETILAVPVETGFDGLVSRPREAWDKAGAEDPRIVVRASGNTYVEPALTNSGVFRVIFCRDMCDPARFPGALAVGKRVRDELDRFAQVITGERATPRHETALWTGAHGLVVLPLDGLMVSELPTLEYRLAYVRRVNQLGAGALMSSGKGEERSDPGTWFW